MNEAQFRLRYFSHNNVKNRGVFSQEGDEGTQVMLCLTCCAPTRIRAQTPDRRENVKTGKLVEASSDYERKRMAERGEKGGGVEVNVGLQRKSFFVKQLRLLTLVGE